MDLSQARTEPSRWWLVAAAMFSCAWAGNQFTPLLIMYRQLGGYSSVTVDAFLGGPVGWPLPSRKVTDRVRSRDSDPTGDM